MTFTFVGKIAVSEDNARTLIPITDGIIYAGFPSPAADYVQDNISLDDLLIKNPSATYIGKVGGDSMRDFGIFEGDYLVVDRALEPKHNCVVIALVNGEYTVKQLDLSAEVPVLRAHNPNFKDILLLDNDELLVAGVVRHSIRTFVS